MVSGELISTLKDEFQDYTAPFKAAPYNSYPAIARIILHTEKVVENILILADSLDLSDNEKHVAEIVARFHDIGRLWLLLPENGEIKITDPAEASLEYLKASQTFGQLDEPTKDIVIQVIKNYNKPDLQKKEGEAILFYIKLLRDADKLDSWRTTAEFIMRKGGMPNMVAELNLSAKPIVAASISKTIIEGGITNKSDLVTFCDFYLFQMAWIFDLNFKKSFQLLNQKQYIRHLYDALPKNDSVIEIYRMIRIHIENHI